MPLLTRMLRSVLPPIPIYQPHHTPVKTPRISFSDSRLFPSSPSLEASRRHQYSYTPSSTRSPDLLDEARSSLYGLPPGLSKEQILQEMRSLPSIYPSPSAAPASAEAQARIDAIRTRIFKLPPGLSSEEIVQEIYRRTPSSPPIPPVDQASLDAARTYLFKLPPGLSSREILQQVRLRRQQGLSPDEMGLGSEWRRESRPYQDAT